MPPISSRLPWARRWLRRDNPPRASIVLAVCDPPLWALQGQLDAIATQSCEDWECIVVDDASTRREVIEMLRTWLDANPTRCHLIERASNGGIAAATNDGIDAATGEILTICDHDDVIHPTAIARVLDHFDAHPDHDVVYTDEQVIDGNGRTIATYGKPDYSPRRHLGHHYLAHLVAARRDAIGDLRVRSAYEPSQDYDFYLRVIERATARGRGVGHIAEVLYSWRAIAGSSALAADEKPEMVGAVERCSQAALDRRGIRASARTVEFDGTPTTSVRVETSAPSPRVDIIAIDASTSPADLNQTVAASDGPVIVLSPDVKRFDGEWAAPLAVEAVRPDVGVVGPLVATEPTTLGTSGAILSVGRVVRPALVDTFAGDPLGSAGPWGAFFVAREVTAVAPWGLAVERSAFESVGGLETDVGLDVAVAELCVRLAALGRSTVWTPAASVRLGGTFVDGRTQLLDSNPSRRAKVDADLRRAGERTPGLSDERYDLTGLAHVDGVMLDPYRRAYMLVCSGDVDLVTSDVFDTVVTRAVARPNDLFIELAGHLELPAHVTPAVFAQARREAERRARQQRSDARRIELLANEDEPSSTGLDDHPDITAPECTLDEIWSLMPSTWVSAAVGSAAELDVEASALRPIPETIGLFQMARNCNVPVVLVSDIYLTGSQLAGLLERIGVDMRLVDEVVTSADHRLGKAHGLLERVVAERGVEPDRVMHVGDNEIADASTAEGLGAEAIHLDVPTFLQHVELPPRPLRRWSSVSGTDLGISAAVRSTLVNAGSLGYDASFQFGAAVAAPVLAGFSRWVSDSTAALGATHTHCMLREGATIAELMQVTAPDGPAPVPIHVSRWVTMRAAVVEGTIEELSTALARRSNLTVEHVTDAFGCDPERVRSLLGTNCVPARQFLDACAALSGDDELRSTIVAASAELRGRVVRYLLDRLRFDSNAPLVVSDVGWGGTIQEGLERILRSAHIDREVVGLYLALSAPGEQRLSRGARMWSYLPAETDDPVAARHSRAVAHHADAIERIMTPEIGTLIDIADDGVPVCRDPSEDPIPHTLAVAQHGVRATALRLADRSLGLSDFNDSRWSSSGLRAAFAEIVADAVTTPSRPLAEALGAWPHDDVAGSSLHSIINPELATAAKFSNVRDIALLDPTGRSWVAGLAATSNPILAAHMAAERAGIPADRLAPESENGMARIAAFETGSDLAAIQVSDVVAVAPAGWSVLRLVGSVESLRSIRFDAGEHDALVDVGLFSIHLSTIDALPQPGRDLDLRDKDITWVDAHPLDEQRFAQQAGGHLLIDIAPAFAPTIRSVEVTVAFRCWRLEGDSELSRAPIAQRIDAHRRRTLNAIRNRLG
ncbi:MAG: glycosyltransferase [Ilumatobacter sp.]|nr:glycosyltransferase [Ilumatobacter sp.]